MCRWLLNIVILLAGVSLAVGVMAQEKDQQKDQPQGDDRPEMRAKVFVDKDSGLSVTRPEGWSSGNAKNGGTVAVFRAAGDSEAQIDVLVSPVKGKGAAGAYFTSFHANLQKAGLVKKGVRKKATYSDKTGIETEYEATSKDHEFRLIVWQFHRDKVAVIVSGFFPTAKRDEYHGDLEKVIKSIEAKK
jgi:hypothetical protein